jgi:hypothetical protein
MSACLITSVENFRSAADRGKSISQPSSKLLQLGVLGLRFFQDGNVGVGVLPDGHEQERPQPELRLLPAVALDKLLETRVRAQRREVRAAINGSEVAATGGKRLPQFVQSLLFVAATCVRRAQHKKDNR